MNFSRLDVRLLKKKEKQHVKVLLQIKFEGCGNYEFGLGLGFVCSESPVSVSEPILTLIYAKCPKILGNMTSECCCIMNLIQEGFELKPEL